MICRPRHSTISEVIGRLCGIGFDIRMTTQITTRMQRLLIAIRRTSANDFPVGVVSRVYHVKLLSLSRHTFQNFACLDPRSCAFTSRRPRPPQVARPWAHHRANWPLKSSGPKHRAQFPGCHFLVNASSFKQQLGNSDSTVRLGCPCPTVQGSTSNWLQPSTVGHEPNILSAALRDPRNILAIVHQKTMFHLWNTVPYPCVVHVFVQWRRTNDASWKNELFMVHPVAHNAVFFRRCRATNVER